MASSSGDSLSPPRPLDVLYAAPRVNSDSWAFSAKLVRNFEITGNFCRCKIFFKNFENFCQPDRYGGNGGSGSESRPRVRACLWCGQSWKWSRWMPSKWRSRVPPGASMAKGGTRPVSTFPVSTTEIASPAPWPNSQGKNSWPKERIFGLPAWNWLLEPKITGNKDSAFYSTKCLRNSTAR